jgi:CHAD domain-containing protein
LEVFASLHDADAHRAVISKLKKLQDCLGSFQDSQVQSDALGHYASELMAEGQVTAETIMAMGGLAAELDRHRAVARATFEEIFERFDSEDTHRTMRELLGSMKP